jgi:uncharacterized membrane protein
MIASVITFLIYLCLLAIVVYIVIWVLGIIGVPLPAKVIQLLWVIVGLIAILWLVQMVLGGGSFHLPVIGR